MKRGKSTPLNAERLQAMQQDLRKASVKSERMSLRGLVRKLMPEIEGQLADGASTADLVVWFSNQGVTLSEGVLRSYISQFRKEQAAGEVAIASPAQQSAVGNSLAVSRPIAGSRARRPGGAVAGDFAQKAKQQERPGPGMVPAVPVKDL